MLGECTHKAQEGHWLRAAVTTAMTMTHSEGTQQGQIELQSPARRIYKYAPKDKESRYREASFTLLYVSAGTEPGGKWAAARSSLISRACISRIVVRTVSTRALEY